MATRPIWDRTLAVGRRRVMSHPRPYTSGRLPLLVGAMVVVPLVGLLFSEGFGRWTRHKPDNFARVDSGLDFSECRRRLHGLGTDSG